MFPIQNAVPTRYPPVITWTLIAINLFVLLFQNSLNPLELEDFLSSFALIPARYSHVLTDRGADLSPADFLPFFTMMFPHGGWLHLILNMWMLWLFGSTVEDRLGHPAISSSILPVAWPPRSRTCSSTRHHRSQPSARRGRLRA